MEFLFDDEWIDRKAGVVRVLGQPHKAPEPILQPEQPWEAAGISARNALLYDAEERKFKLWYRSRVRNAECGMRRADKGSGSGSPTPHSAPRTPHSEAERVFVCYAESDDGLRWTRPSLGRVRFEGSDDNNIAMEADEADGVIWNVVKDGVERDPERRYKALGFAVSAESGLRDVPAGTRGVCFASSPDGIRWTAPRLVMHTRDLTDCDCVLNERDPTSGKWVAFLRPRTSPKRRFIGYATSDDFEHWTLPRMLLTPDAEDDEWTEFYGLTAVTVGGWRVGSLWIFHNNPSLSPMTNELVYSRDGFHYHRAMPRTEFLPLGPPGAPDSRMLHPFAFLEHGNEFLLYYQGSNRDHGSDRGQEMPPGRPAPGEESRSVMGLARLPWGHFCGLRARYDGMVETKWRCNYGDGGVQAVAALEPGGAICAEILDQYGAVIPGWDRAGCRVRDGDDGRLRFSWGSDDLVGSYGQTSAAGGAVGHVVKLRFHLHRATLFGFQVGAEETLPAYL